MGFRIRIGHLLQKELKLPSSYVLIHFECFCKSQEIQGNAKESEVDDGTFDFSQNTWFQKTLPRKVLNTPRSSRFSF